MNPAGRARGCKDFPRAITGHERPVNALGPRLVSVPVRHRVELGPLSGQSGGKERSPRWRLCVLLTQTV
jgi:hypothetical protein